MPHRGYPTAIVNKSSLEKNKNKVDKQTLINLLNENYLLGLCHRWVAPTGQKISYTTRWLQTGSPDGAAENSLFVYPVRFVVSKIGLQK